MAGKDIGVLLKLITDKMKSDADTDLKQYNITFTQSRTLVCLREHGGQATQKELEEYLCVSHPTIVGIISRMERSGYVVSWFDPNDKRSKIISITDKAEALGEQMRQITSQKEKALVRGLSDEQIKELEKMLSVLLENITSK